MGLNFRGNMNLEKPFNKYKKLLCKNDIIFLVDFGLSFVLIYGFFYKVYLLSYKDLLCGLHI